MSEFYKGKYFIVFYDKTDENLLYLFDNVRDILRFMRKAITRNNVMLINVMLRRALMTDTHFCRFLTGKTMRVHLIDVNEDDSDDINEQGEIYGTDD